MRSFVAVPLPDALIPALTRVQDCIEIGRALPEDDLHLTLAFLGDVPDSALSDLHDALASTPLPTATLEIRGLTTFGGRAPRLLAAEATKHPDLTALHSAVTRAIRAAGIDLPRKRFHPHVTLVRFGAGLSRNGQAKLHRAIAPLVGLALPPARAGAVALVSSTLTPDGAVYEELARYPLTTEPSARG